MCAQTSDAFGATTVGLEKAAKENRFQQLAFYLWARSGVDELAAGDEPDMPDEQPVCTVDTVCAICTDDERDRPQTSFRVSNLSAVIQEEEEEQELEAAQSVASSQKQPSSTALKTASLEPTGSQADVGASEQKSVSSVLEKKSTEQASVASVGSRQASAQQLEAPKSSPTSVASHGSVADAEEQKSGEKLTSSKTEVTDDTANEENAN